MYEGIFYLFWVHIIQNAFRSHLKNTIKCYFTRKACVISSGVLSGNLCQTGTHYST